MEADLSGPVTDLLAYWGYTVYSEVPLPGGDFRVVDLVGLKHTPWATSLIGVELKTSLTRQARRQAYDILSATPAVYVAVASTPRTQSVERCKQWGIGILLVENGVAHIHTRPTGKYRPIHYWTAMMHGRLKHMEPGGVAGRPNELGVGPAQDVRQRIQAYRMDHPGAMWKQLYAAVPNHYASAASMCNAMRMVDERQAWRERKRARREVPNGN